MEVAITHRVYILHLKIISVVEFRFNTSTNYPQFPFHFFSFYPKKKRTKTISRQWIINNEESKLPFPSPTPSTRNKKINILKLRPTPRQGSSFASQGSRTLLYKLVLGSSTSLSSTPELSMGGVVRSDGLLLPFSHHKNCNCFHPAHF